MRIAHLILMVIFLMPNTILAKEIILETNLPDIGHLAHSELPVHDERLMGEAIMQKINGTDAVITDPIVNEYLRQMAAKFNAHIHNIDFKLHFFAIHTPELNAFAFFGGHVAVHSGLITAVERESELAAVLAHESSHISQHHLARILANNKKLMPLTLVELLAAATIGALGAPEAGIHLANAAMAGHMQQMINYTRDHEQEADRLGILLLSKTGFDPEGMPDVFQKLNQKTYYMDKPPEYLLTHPMFESRIADAQNRIDKLDYKRLPESDFFYFVRARLEVAKDDNVKRVINVFKERLDKGHYKNKAATEYGYALALLKKQQYIEANTIMQKLMEQYPDEWILAVGKAEIEFAAGQTELSLKRLQYLIDRYPHNQALVLFYIEGLLLTKQPEPALKLLTQCEHLHPLNPTIFQMYARAYSMTKNTIALHRSQAEWHYLKGEFKEAYKQLEIGLEYAERHPKLAKQIHHRKEDMEKVEKYQRKL